MGFRSRLTSLFVIVLAFAATPAAADTVTYENSRFGTSISFPADIFVTQMDPPENGDGMTWLSDDGASLAVYGMNNALMADTETLADQASAREGFETTYRRVERNWFVLSGYEGANIFYYRFELGADDVIHAMLLRYPTALRQKYDPLVAPLAATLAGP